MIRDIKSEMKNAKILSILILIIGVILASISMVLFINKDTLQIFPRMDIAWIGFALGAIIVCVSGFHLLFFSGKKKDWINGTDEREIFIASQSSMVGYLVQTILLGIGFFILIFMGYLNKVTAFSIISIIVISGFVSWIYKRYLRKNV